MADGKRVLSLTRCSLLARRTTAGRLPGAASSSFRRPAVGFADATFAGEAKRPVEGEARLSPHVVRRSPEAQGALEPSRPSTRMTVDARTDAPRGCGARRLPHARRARACRGVWGPVLSPGAPQPSAPARGDSAASRGPSILGRRVGVVLPLIGSPSAGLHGQCVSREPSPPRDVFCTAHVSALLLSGLLESRPASSRPVCLPEDPAAALGLEPAGDGGRYGVSNLPPPTRRIRTYVRRRPRVLRTRRIRAIQSRGNHVPLHCIASVPAHDAYG